MYDEVKIKVFFKTRHCGLRKKLLMNLFEIPALKHPAKALLNSGLERYEAKFSNFELSESTVRCLKF